MKKRIVSLFMALVMALSLIPTTVWAEVAEGSEGSLGSVHVTVENTTYTEVESADLKGTLVNTDVTLTADATMMSCVASALETAGYTAVGAENETCVSFIFMLITPSAVSWLSGISLSRRNTPPAFPVRREGTPSVRKNAKRPSIVQPVASLSSLWANGNAATAFAPPGVCSR